MQSVFRGGIDLQITLSPDEVRTGSRPPTPHAEFPILTCPLTSDRGKEIGKVRLQKTATTPLGRDVVEKDDLFFLKHEPGDWSIQLGFRPYFDLKERGSITRRLPYGDNTLHIDIEGGHPLNTSTKP
ncbi:hypothetical protein CMI48_02605 [Candidatus Pacearchaeota archaeon]|nr:hypothetical protein [Candidatus Pacearchaeota archaeon]|tara:strand:- start:551 stop:931 length:381 start_codon:yes stop_codon:yes gene_type:complete